MDHVEMRQRNAAETLAILYREGPAKMAALQHRSGLSRRTLELILEDLIASGWAHELDPQQDGPTGAGRPARRFGFRYDAAHVVALQLEAGQIHGTVADLAVTELASHRVSVPILTDRAERLRAIDQCIRDLLASAGVDRSSVVAVTVSTPGIVQDDGTVDLPMTMPGWTGFSLSASLGQLFDCPVRVENDAKLAALGEKWARDDGVQDFVYIFGDDERLGLGLVVRNELHRGLNGAAGEITWAGMLGMRDLSSPLLNGLDDEDAPGHAIAVATLASGRVRPSSLKLFWPGRRRLGCC